MKPINVELDDEWDEEPERPIQYWELNEHFYFDIRDRTRDLKSS